MGFNKVNAVVSESLAYTATLSAQGPNVAELTLTYTNTAALDEGCVHAVPSYGPDQTYEDLVQQCYWNYRRVLVPVGAQLIGTTRIPIGAGQLITQRPNDGATAPSTEAGKTVFSTLILVGRGQRLDTHLRYSLPRDVLQSVADRRVYHLRIQKQPGAGRWPVSATVVWPSGYQLVDAAPLATSVSANAATFQAVLNADVDVTLVFKSAP
jgi:hypothetical protein